MIPKTMLDKKQIQALNWAITGENTFISGFAGVGKSAVIREIINEMRTAGKKVVVCAFTRRAALLLDDGGVTIFKAFNTFPGGLEFDEQGMRRLLDSFASEADVIVIDEISMCSKGLFSYICKAIRKISKEKGYKDIQLIVSGDFLQLPPIHEKGKEAEFAFESSWWKKMEFKTVVLEEAHRQRDPEFMKHLNEIRIGKNIKENLQYLKENAHYLEKKEDAVTLCSYRADVNKVNDELIRKLPGEAVHYSARTNSQTYMDSLSIRSEMDLKIGTFVMTVYNDPDDRYYNGLTGHIIAMSEDSVTIEFADSTDEKPHIEEVGYHTWYNEETSEYAEQLPVIPAYAVTIHKAQGCTLDDVNVNPKCFEDGQFYVAISRVKSIENLYITEELSEKDLKVNAKALAFYEECEETYQNLDKEARLREGGECNEGV